MDSLEPGQQAAPHPYLRWYSTNGHTKPKTEYVRSAYEPPRDRYWLHLLLFVITALTTMLVGAEMATNRSWWTDRTALGFPQLGLADLVLGAPYAFGFLLFLTCHEFGHYFTSRWHRVRCSLPYYLPFYLPAEISMINIGSFGAIIRIRDRPDSNLKYFDIGIAGPLAGFVISVLLLWVGFATLPPLDDYLRPIHPEYFKVLGHAPNHDETLLNFGGGLALGSNLIFSFFEQFVADPARLPNHFELVHYPLLFAGYITLFFTALNLLPIGQLDGGHVTYGLLGRKWAGRVSRGVVVALLVYCGMGLRHDGLGVGDLLESVLFYSLVLYVARQLVGSGKWLPALGLASAIVLSAYTLRLLLPTVEGNTMWLLFVFMAVRFVRLDHPPAQLEIPLDGKRKLLGWLALAVFLLCFTPDPVKIVEGVQRNTIFTQVLTILLP